VRGWASNVVAKLNKYKQFVAAEYNMLDTEANEIILDECERSRLSFLARELDKIRALEKIKMRQKARDRSIKEGDRNIAYFHAVASQRARKKRIDSLQGPDGLVHETSEILKVAANFYKDLFRKESRGSFSLDNNFWGGGQRIR
jgi:hypothetical protein